MDKDAFFTGYTFWDMENGKSILRAVYYPEGEAGGEPVVIPEPGSESIIVIMFCLQRTTWSSKESDCAYVGNCCKFLTLIRRGQKNDSTVTLGNKLKHSFSN